MNYATFWQRFAAMWIDVIVILPFVFFLTWLHSVFNAAALLVPMATASCVYSIYCHGRFGQTVGKHVMGIRVVRMDGERIGWREALLRSSVDVAFTTVDLIASYVIFAALTDAELNSAAGSGWMQRRSIIKSHMPIWCTWTSAVGQAWYLSEVIVMLFNKKRRAFHDFIAGTVVKTEKKTTVTLTQSD